MNDFSKKTIKSLASKGITLIGLTTITGTDGTYANGERGYILNDNGTQRIMNWLQVDKLAR
jgi:hypothetical protein